MRVNDPGFFGLPEAPCTGYREGKHCKDGVLKADTTRAEGTLQHRDGHARVGDLVWMDCSYCCADME